jgi:hypothetical protein
VAFSVYVVAHLCHNGYRHVNRLFEIILWTLTKPVSQCIPTVRAMKREAKTEILRARCDSALKRDLQLLAQLRMLDTSDIVRIACADYVHRSRQNNEAQTTARGNH